MWRSTKGSNVSIERLSTDQLVTLVSRENLGSQKRCREFVWLPREDLT